MRSTKKRHVTPQLRLRIFAGPNGSGKSTVITAIRKYTVNHKPLDFGYYINADDIAATLKRGQFDFTPFSITVKRKEFVQLALDSGLINAAFPEEIFKECFSISKNSLKLKDQVLIERVAQVIAEYLRKKLLQEEKRFSFETVFSHPSKLDFMQQAVEKGYKIYLYFVSTESPEINTFRVEARTKKGGHSVPPDKISSRYYRSLDLLYDAAQLCYQVFFFDNSYDGEDANLFAHFKNVKGEKLWDPINEQDVPQWFLKYYSDKVKKAKQED